MMLKFRNYLIGLVLIVAFISGGAFYTFAEEKGDTTTTNTSKDESGIRKDTRLSSISRFDSEKEARSIPAASKIEGILKEIIIEAEGDSDTQEKIIYALETKKDGLVSVEFAARMKKNLRNSYLEAEGSWSNNTFIIKKINSIIPENSRIITRSEVETLDENGNPISFNFYGPELTQGNYKVLVLPVNFSDVPSEPISVNTLREILYSSPTSINAQLKEMSKYRFELSGIQRPDIDIANWITLPRTSENCWNNMTTTWTNEARVLAQAQGFQANDYRSVILIFPNNIPSCQGWGGQANIGTLGNDNQNNNVWIRWDPALDLVFLRSMLIHELGHNFGLMHASSVKNCGNQNVIPDNCLMIEYGDDFSPMGGGGVYFLRNHNNFHLQQLGWLSPGGKVANLPQAGTYNLRLFSPSFTTHGYQVVSFPLKNSAGVPTGQSVYLELRRELLPFDRFTGDFGQNATKGISLRFASSNLSSQLKSYIFDYNENTPDLRDAAIEVGQVYTDQNFGFTVRPISISPQFGAQVVVELTR